VSPSPSSRGGAIRRGWHIIDLLLGLRGGLVCGLAGGLWAGRPGLRSARLGWTTRSVLCQAAEQGTWFEPWLLALDSRVWSSAYQRESLYA